MPVVSKVSRCACLAGLLVAFMNGASTPAQNHVFGRLLRRGDEAAPKLRKQIFDSSDSDGIGKIIKWMNKAQSAMQDLKLAKAPTPKFVVLGRQSAGKTRLIETIAGVPFNHVSKGTATTRPTRITFLKDTKVPDHTAQWSIFNEETQEMESVSTEDLTSSLTKLHTQDTAIDVLDGKRAPVIREKYIELECRSSNSYNIVIVDLPGMIERLPPNTREDSQKFKNIHKIEEITEEHIMDTDNRIILLNEAADVENLEFDKMVLKRFFPDGGKTQDWSRFSVVRTKFDQYDVPQNLDEGVHVNRWLRFESTEDQVDYFKKGMKHATLSCPGPKYGANKTFKTQEEFQKETGRLNAADLKRVGNLQQQLLDSSAFPEETQKESSTLLKTVGFDNFARQLQTDVQQLFKEKLPEVASKLREEGLRLVKEREKASRAIKCEEDLTEVKKEMGANFAEVVGAVGRIKNPINVQESKTWTEYTKAGTEVKKAKATVVPTSTLQEDIEVFINGKTDGSGALVKKGLQMDDIFVEKIETDESLSSDLHEKFVLEQQLTRETAFAQLKENLVTHQSALAKKENLKGIENTSGEKFLGLVEDVTDYMHTAEANFSAEFAEERYSSVSDDKIQQRKNIVRDFIQADGKQMLLNHITVVGRRVQQWLRELAPRTQIYMSESLAIKKLEEKRRDVGESWESLKMAKIKEAPVYTAVYNQFDDYTEILFKNFRLHYVKYLEALLYDPYSLFKTTLIGASRKQKRSASQRKPLFEPDQAEVQAKIEELAAEQSADDAESVEDLDAEFQKELAEEGLDPSGAKRSKVKVSRKKTKVQKQDVDESSDEEKGPKSEEKHIKLARYEAERCRLIDDKIREMFDEPTDDGEALRWSDAKKTGKSAESLTKLLFRFARARVADGLSAQIDRFFIQPVTNSKANMQDFETSIPDFSDHMKKMSKDCFKPNQKVIQEETKKKDRANEAMEKVKALLDEQKLLPRV